MANGVCGLPPFDPFASIDPLICSCDHVYNPSPVTIAEDLLSSFGTRSEAEHSDDEWDNDTEQVFEGNIFDILDDEEE